MAVLEHYPEEKYAKVTSDKTNVTYTIHKDISGHRFFEFKASKGAVPDCLKGKYSSIQNAFKAFEAFERAKKQTFSAKRKELDKERADKRAKLQSESSK